MSSFEVIENVYSTMQSKVYHVIHKDSGTHLALKCYQKAHMRDFQKVQAAREIWFHSRMFHPFLISMYAAWTEGERICLAIEFAPIGSAFRKLRHCGSFSEEVCAKYIIFQTLSALKFLHELGLIHRDIKPENILLTSDGCKLADFGLVINHIEESANSCLGTFDYMVRCSPQILALAHTHLLFTMSIS
jgi:serine/threonine protein kinase